MENAYAPPRSEVTVVLEGAPLFTPTQIAAAAFFGTLGASAWLARANYIALGEREKGNSTLVKGLLIIAVIMGLAAVLPEQIPGVAYLIPQLMLARKVSQDAFGAHVATHPKASNLRVAGVSIVFLLLVAAFVFGIAMALEPDLLSP